MALRVKTPRLIDRFAEFIGRHWTIWITIAVIAMFAGLIADRVAEPSAAVVVGTVQALTVVLYVYLLLIWLLFRSWGPKTTAILELWPLAGLRIFFFVVATPFAFLALILVGLKFFYGAF